MPDLQSNRNSESNSKEFDSSIRYIPSSNPDVAAGNFPSVSFYDQNSHSHYSADYHDGRFTKSNINILGDGYQVPFSQFKIAENNIYHAYPGHCYYNIN